MATMQALRTQAKEAGVPTQEIRSAESAEELQGLIAGYISMGGKSDERRTKVVVKKKTGKRGTVRKATTRKATVAKRGPGRPKGSTNKPKAVIKRGPGRPKGSTNKPKATTRKAVKTAAKNGRVRNVQSTEGRHILEGVNYSDTDGWNPREDSAPDVILRALRRFKGDREKAFNYLLPSVWDFVGRKMQNGSKRTKASAEAMLRYRIARTDWDFAMKTGQHEASENRVQYGTGGTGNGSFKPAKKKVAVKAPKRRGRPPGRKTATATPKRRGRPPGSKNKPKATTTRKPAARTTRKAPAKRTMKRR